MPWEVIAVEEFAAWLLGESDGVQIETAARVAVLAEFGPQLGRPSVETIQGSAFTNLKELRYKVDRRLYRVLFAFDPSRRTVHLLGGDKGVLKGSAIASQYLGSQNYALGSAMAVLVLLAVAVIVVLLVRLTRGFEEIGQ